MNENKILTKAEFVFLRHKLKADGKKIVLCHGVFDLLHYGHIEHLKNAKTQGDILVVSITAEKYVNKGPGRPYFSNRQRMAFLASLEIVDYVLLSEAVTVQDIVETVQPDVYAKGREYKTAENDITGNIASEQEIVERYGGRIYFTEGEVYSSTKLLNNYFATLPENVMQTSYALKNKYGINFIDRIREYIESFRKEKILVIGDIILDEYVFCNVQGLTMKNSTLSTFYEYEERYAGGALAVAKHLANFSDDVTICSMMGTEKNLCDFVHESMQKIKLEILYDEKFVTPVKRRFLRQNSQRQEYDKMFSINYLMTRKQRENFDYLQFQQKLEDMVSQYDLVVVCDYGHGLLENKAVNIIETKAKFLSVNCQTNSANYGTNVITKYSRADSFVVDEKELRLAFGEALTHREDLIKELTERLKSKCSWVTIGASGAIGNTQMEQSLCPALLLKVKDTVGAGDAFYALASLCAQKNIPIDIATLIANTAGALKTNIIGNKESIKKVDVLKFLSTILNV